VCALQCDRSKDPDVWKCTECLGIPKESYDSLFDCKELYCLCSKGESVISGSMQYMARNDDRIVCFLERLLDKLTSLETRLNANTEESKLHSLEQRITGLEMRMADDDVNDRMVVMIWTRRRSWIENSERRIS